MAPLEQARPLAPPAASRWPHRLCLLVLVIGLMAVLATHVAWVMSNTAPPREDDNMQLMKSLQFQRGLMAAGPHVLEPLWLGTAVDFYPPLTYFVTFVFYQGLGTSEQTGRLSLLPFVLVLAGSLYGMGRRLWGPAAGLTAALAGITAPTFAHYSHSYFIDVPLTAMVALNLYCLLLTRDFEDESGSLMWGLSVGLGLMTKWTFLAWVAIPNLLALVAFFRRDARVAGLVLATLGNVTMALVWWRANKPFLPPQTWEPQIVGVYLAVFTALALLLAWLQARYRLLSTSRGFAWGIWLAACLALPWYAENVGSLRAGTQMMGELMGSYSLGMKVRCNLQALSQMIWILPMLLLAGLAWGLARDASRRATTWVASCGLASFVAMTLLLPFAARYIMPVLPYGVLLAFSWVQGLGRWTFAGILVLLPLFAWQVAGTLPAAAPLFPPAFRSAAAVLLAAPPPPPEQRDYHVDDVLDRVMATSGKHDEAVVWVMNNHDQNLVQARVYEYFAVRRSLPVAILQAEVDDLAAMDEERRHRLARGTHMLLLSNRETPLASWLRLAQARLHWKLEPLATFALPDGYTATLYRRVVKQPEKIPRINRGRATRAGRRAGRSSLPPTSGDGSWSRVHRRPQSPPGLRTLPPRDGRERSATGDCTPGPALRRALRWARRGGGQSPVSPHLTRRDGADGLVDAAVKRGGARQVERQERKVLQLPRQVADDGRDGLRHGGRWKRGIRQLLAATPQRVRLGLWKMQAADADLARADGADAQRCFEEVVVLAGSHAGAFDGGTGGSPCLLAGPLAARNPSVDRKGRPHMARSRRA